jgi:hypothetical protein
MTEVAPFTGVWIETKLEFGACLDAVVAHFTGYRGQFT